MRMLLLSSLLAVGSATTATWAPAAAPAEPMATRCNGNDGCNVGSFCVKAVGAVAGLSSTLPTTSSCEKSSDCGAGSSCHRAVGSVGVCFRP